MTHPVTIAPYLKAVIAAVAAGASYLAGVLGAESTLTDISLVQWLGLVPVLAATFGITWRVPNKELSPHA